MIRGSVASLPGAARIMEVRAAEARWTDSSDEHAELYGFELHTDNVIVRGHAARDLISGRIYWEASFLPQHGDLTTEHDAGGESVHIAAACIALHEAALAFDRAQVLTVVAD